MNLPEVINHAAGPLVVGPIQHNAVIERRGLAIEVSAQQGLSACGRWRQVLRPVTDAALFTPLYPLDDHRVMWDQAVQRLQRV